MSTIRYEIREPRTTNPIDFALPKFTRRDPRYFDNVTVADSIRRKNGWYDCTVWFQDDAHSTARFYDRHGDEIASCTIVFPQSI